MEVTTWFSIGRLVSSTVRQNRWYQKFIILGRGRTGSNLLVSLLNSHPSIEVTEEIFGVVDEDMLLKRRRDPIRYVQEVVFGRHKFSVKAVGFKLFYHQAQCREEKIIWDYLRSMTSLKIIHIKRHNLLRMHLSRRIMEKTGKHKKFAWETHGCENKQVVLNKNELDEAFIETVRKQEVHDRVFKANKLIHVFYEDLVADTDSEIIRILNFLGIAHRPCSTDLVKQNPEPLCNLIKNYDELKREFKGSRWEGFFDD